MTTASASRSTHRAKLLQAARTLLRERHYGNITARDLVAASNTNLGSIGYHFGSKEALLNEAIGLAFEEWTDAIIAATRIESGPQPPALTTALGTVLDRYDTIRPYHHACIEALARSARSPQLRDQLAAHYERQRDRVAALLAASGEGPAAVDDARHLASLVIAAVDGLLIQRFIDPDGAPTSQDLAAVTAHAAPAATSSENLEPGRPRSAGGRADDGAAL